MNPTPVAVTRCGTRWRWTCTALGRDTQSQAIYADRGNAHADGMRHHHTTHERSGQ